MYLYYFLTAGYLQHIVQLSLLYLFMIMDITKFLDRKKKEFSSQSADGDNLKNHAKKVIAASVPPTSPGDVFEESLKSGDCVKILVNCMQNIEKQVK